MQLTDTTQNIITPVPLQFYIIDGFMHVLCTLAASQMAQDTLVWWT